MLLLGLLNMKQTAYKKLMLVIFILNSIICKFAYSSDIHQLSAINNIGVTSFRPFITKWKIDKPNTLVRLPTWQDGYSYIIDWGDGVVEHWQDAPLKKNQQVAQHLASHQYAEAGIYQLKIWGKFPQIHFDNGIKNGDAPGIDKNKIIEIVQWGDIKWRSMGAAFWGCQNLNVTATDAPDLSNVDKTNGMFRDAKSFNAKINHWDVSSVKNMANMFNGAERFDQNIGSWELGAVKSLRHFLKGVTLSVENYDALLIGWSEQSSTLKKRIKFDAGNSQYSTAGEIAKRQLIEQNKWQFKDGGLFKQD